MLLAYAINPYMSKQGGPRSVFFRNSIWVQMVSVVDRCKRVLVTLIRTLAGLYACSEESWLRTPLNTFSIKKQWKSSILLSRWGSRCKLSAEPQRSLNAFSIEKTSILLSPWSSRHKLSAEPQQSLNAFSIEKTMKIKNYLEPLRLPSQAFGTTSREPQRIFNWKNNAKSTSLIRWGPWWLLAF